MGVSDVRDHLAQQQTQINQRQSVCVCVCERERERESERAGSEESVKHALICSCFIPLQSGEANVSSAPPVGFPRLGNVKGQRAV